MMGAFNPSNVRGRSEHLDQYDRGGPLGIIGDITMRQPIESFQCLRSVRMCTVDAAHRSARIVATGAGSASWAIAGTGRYRVARGEPAHIVQLDKKREVKVAINKMAVTTEPLDIDDRAELRAGMPVGADVELMGEQAALEERRERLAWAAVTDLAAERAFMFNPDTTPFDNVTTLALLTGNPQWHQAAAKPLEDLRAASRKYWLTCGRHPSAMDIHWSLVDIVQEAQALRTPERPDPLDMNEAMRRIGRAAGIHPSAINIMGTLADDAAPGGRLPELNNLFAPAFRMYERGSDRMRAHIGSGRITLTEPCTSLWLFEDMVRGYAKATDYAGLMNFNQADGLLEPLGLGAAAAFAYLEVEKPKMTEFELFGFNAEVPLFPNLNLTVGAVVPESISGPLRS